MGSDGGLLLENQRPEEHGARERVPIVEEGHLALLVGPRACRVAISPGRVLATRQQAAAAGVYAAVFARTQARATTEREHRAGVRPHRPVIQVLRRATQVR